MIDPVLDLKLRLDDEEPEVRRRAVQELATLPAPDSCELLLVALGDVDWRVRKEAAIVTPRIEPRTAVVFAVARALDERDNVGLRNAAVEALALLGPDAVPAAIDALSRLDADGRKLAVEVLAGAPTLAGVRALVRALADEDANVSSAAAEALASAGLAGAEARDLAANALGALLEQSDVGVRLAALSGLRALEAEVPWALLEPLLAEPLLQRAAVVLAGGSVVPRALLALTEAVCDENPTLARDGAVALGLSIERAPSDVLELAARTLRAAPAGRARLRALARGEDDPVARGAALLALGLNRDPDDVALLAGALADDAVAERAEAALRLFGHEAVEPLLAAGRSAAPSLRGATISMLPQLSPSEPAPLAALRDALREDAPEVVVPALRSLAIVGAASDLLAVVRHVGAKDPRLASTARSSFLALAMRHPGAARSFLQQRDPLGEDALVAVTAIDGIARSGSAEADDTAFVAGALTHRDAIVRRAAIEALASIGGDDAARFVLFALADEAMDVALAGIRALGKLGRAGELAQLAASTKDPLRLGFVLRALAQADPARAFAAALPLVRSTSAEVAAAAVEVVGTAEMAGRVSALLDALGHADREVVKLALTQLAGIDEERAFDAIARALEQDDEEVRRHAAELLGQASAATPEAEGLLRARLDRERSSTVRAAMMEALRGPSPRRSPKREGR